MSSKSRSATKVAANPNYVRSRSILKDVDLFDADFFGILPKEAALIDPQQRLFLECSWEAFEDAGYDPAAYPGSVGVIAGVAANSYFLQQVLAQPGFTDDFLKNYQIGNYTAMMGNYPDYLATRVAYKFNLKGPSFTVQAACSTALVAVCQACQSLLTYQSDMMLAGGRRSPSRSRRSAAISTRKAAWVRPTATAGPSTTTRRAPSSAPDSESSCSSASKMPSPMATRFTPSSAASPPTTMAGNKVGLHRAPASKARQTSSPWRSRPPASNPNPSATSKPTGTATPLGDPIELAALEKAFRRFPQLEDGRKKLLHHRHCQG